MSSLRGDVPALLESAAAILLDFDGPICDVFANRPASGVAEVLRTEIARHGTLIPDAIVGESDPLAVLRWMGTSTNSSTVSIVDSRLVREELAAVETVSPSEGLADFLRSVKKSLPIVIVTNNSEPAVAAFMRRVGLAESIQGVSGRVLGRPDLMKPSPEPLFRAAEAVGVRADQCLMIGDSLTDLEASSAAGCTTILLANKRRKEEVFLASTADAVITTMADLTPETNS